MNTHRPVIATLPILTRRTPSAYHEAGHAFCAWYRRGEEGQGGMVGETAEEGHCKNSWRARGTLLTQGISLPEDATLHAALSAEVESAMAIFLAGPLVEARYRGINGTETLAGSHDYEDAQQVLQRWYAAWGKTPTAWTLHSVLTLMETEVQRWLRHANVWPTIEVLAHALIEEGSLPGRRVDMLCRKVYGAPKVFRRSKKASVLL
jgi:hypothetical protein